LGKNLAPGEQEQGKAEQEPHGPGVRRHSEAATAHRLLLSIHG
jgi:hypothetical protein